MEATVEHGTRMRVAPCANNSRKQGGRGICPGGSIKASQYICTTLNPRTFPRCWGHLGDTTALLLYPRRARVRCVGDLVRRSRGGRAGTTLRGSFFTIFIISGIRAFSRPPFLPALPENTPAPFICDPPPCPTTSLRYNAHEPRSPCPCN